MAKKKFDAQGNDKKALGKLISDLRINKNMSLRQFAEKIHLPPSNLSYIERGINAPSAEIYEQIIKELAPSETEHKKMDTLYSRIRSVPPPDVCNVLLKIPELGEKIKILNNVLLTSNQLEHIEALFVTFK